LVVAYEAVPAMTRKSVGKYHGWPLAAPDEEGAWGAHMIETTVSH
jgi:hypothetical protein